MDVLTNIEKYLQDNNIEKAYELIENNEKEYNSNSEFWNLKGILCIKVNEFNTAINCFKEAIKKKKDDWEYYYNLAYCYECIDCSTEAALNYGLSCKYGDESIYEMLKSKFDGKLLNIFNGALKNKEKLFIILSSCPWAENQQRMHHISKSLNKLGNEVIYVSPAKKINDEFINEDNMLNITMNNINLVDGVSIIQPIVLENNISNYTDVIQCCIDNFSSEVVIISYMPYQVNHIKNLRGEFLHIYDCVDDHSDIESAFWANKMDPLWEQELMDIADAITTTSITLYSRRVGLEKRNNIYLSPNAVDEFDFKIEDCNMPLELENIPEPRVVYSGYIYERFDVDLFIKVVKENPDKSFVIIGGIKDGLINEKLDNLYLLGNKKHSELKNYLRYMQIGINPLRTTAKMVLSCDCIKNYEYIACGLPVISTDMPDAIIGNENIHIGNNFEKFNDLIRNYEELKFREEDRKKFMIENSWIEKAILFSEIANKSNFSESNSDEIDKLKKKLDEKYEVNKYSTASIPRTMLSFLNSPSMFYDLAKETYENFPCTESFILLMKSLYENNEKKELKEIIKKSSLIENELKEEAKYRNYSEDILDLICNMVIGDYREVLRLIDCIKEQDLKESFICYINYKLNNTIDVGYLTNRKNPINVYLKEQYYNKKRYFLIKANNIDSQALKNVFKQKDIDIEQVYEIDFNKDVCINAEIIKEIQRITENENNKIIIYYNDNYINQVRELVNLGIENCIIAVYANEEMHCIEIDKDLMNSIRKKEYLKTITINEFNNDDGNVYAMLKFIPKYIKEKYIINKIIGKEVWSIENQIKVPLQSSITLSGYATFLYYKKFTYNIELYHGSLIVKGCSNMDKVDNNSGGNKFVWDNVDKVVIPSDMNKMMFAACYGVPVNKFLVSGEPRLDLLLESDGRKKLEKILNKNLTGKKVIFNMPTYHNFKDIDRVEGANDFNGQIKIYDFDYEKFDDFLEQNNMILLTKYHHVEGAGNKYKSYKNMFNITSIDLKENNMNLYEIINSGDLLITDYSSVYGDFLFMEKPIIFTNSDIDVYRETRGILLEPFEEWTAGPKVNTQESLEEEILKCINEKDYFLEERRKFKNIFYKYEDKLSSERVWKFIDSKFIEFNEKEM